MNYHPRDEVVSGGKALPARPIRLLDQLTERCRVKHYSLRDTAMLQLARDGVSRIDSQNHYDHSSSAMQDLPGTVSTTRIATSANARARSRARLTICAPFTPTAGSIS